MALLLTALKFILIGVWPKTNLCYLIMMMGCLCISSSSCPAWEMINVPTFLVMASVDTVWPWRTFIVLRCLPILFLPSRLCEGRCQQEPMEVALQIVWEEKGQTVILGWLVESQVRDFLGQEDHCSQVPVKWCHIKESSCLTCGGLSHG